MNTIQLTAEETANYARTDDVGASTRREFRERAQGFADQYDTVVEVHDCDGVVLHAAEPQRKAY